MDSESCESEESYYSEYKDKFPRNRDDRVYSYPRKETLPINKSDKHLELRNRHLSDHTHMYATYNKVNEPIIEAPRSFMSLNSIKGESDESEISPYQNSSGFVYGSNGKIIPINSIFNINGRPFLVNDNQAQYNFDHDRRFRTGEENFGHAGEEFTNNERILINQLEGRQKFSDVYNFNDGSLHISQSDFIKPAKSGYVKQKYGNIWNLRLSINDDYLPEVYKRSELTIEKQDKLKETDKEVANEDPEFFEPHHFWGELSQSQ